MPIRKQVCECGGEARFCILVYGIPPKPTHCKKCASLEMVNVTSGKMCKKDVDPPCKNKATHGHVDEPAVVCEGHKVTGMVNTKKERVKKNIAAGQKYKGICHYDGCTISGTFVVPGSEEKWCGEHAPEDAISTDVRICEFEDENGKCITRASYNFPGQTRGIRCSPHQLEGMKDVVNPKCIFDGCDTKPNYNYENETSGLYCGDHRLEGMINVYEGRICKEPGCTTRTCYGYPGGEPEYCAPHGKEGMINVVTPRCQHESCDTVPNYNVPGSTCALFCAIHKKPGMVDVSNYVCQFEGCPHYALYGIPQEQPTTCWEHKSPNMVIAPRRKCCVDGCKNCAVYGKCTHERCLRHKLDGDINFTEQTCISCGLEAILRDGICGMCNPTIYERTRLAKQNAVEDVLQENEMVFVSKDVMIDGGVCGRARPDFVFDCGTHFVVLEVDENQHRGYNKECEITRMKQISQSFGMQTIFIRYNPDPYSVKPKTRRLTTSFHTRMSTLLEVLNYYMATNVETLRTFGFLSAVYLFYDGYDKNSIIPVTITPYD